MSERNLKSQLIDLLKRHHLLSVSDILEKLKAEGKTYNKTSVYRSLETLLEEGLICRQYFNEAQALYELREDHHTHMVCDNCGKIESTECIYEEPKNNINFKIDHHHVTLVGKCQDCQ
jgi:Fe2+ or Zn2+ uptake regulation protein